MRRANEGYAAAERDANKARIIIHRANKDYPYAEKAREKMRAH
jgi:hypothetical protein